MKKVILVDDEPDARQLLREYLEDYPSYQIIGEATNGLDAVELINLLKPDTLFLDIQMPGKNGFEVLTELDELPELIFSTAYDEFAIKAFEVHAVDYLLKPYDKRRLEKAMNRLRSNQEKIAPFTEGLIRQGNSYPDRVILHQANRRVMIKTAGILSGEAYGDYTRVHTLKEEFLSTKGISDLMKIFDPTKFKRIHRSHFVNLDQVIELQKKGRYQFLILKNGQEVKISERFLPELKKLVL